MLAGLGFLESACHPVSGYCWTSICVKTKPKLALCAHGIARGALAHQLRRVDGKL